MDNYWIIVGIVYYVVGYGLWIDVCKRRGKIVLGDIFEGVLLSFFWFFVLIAAVFDGMQDVTIWERKQ